MSRSNGQTNTPTSTFTPTNTYTSTPTYTFTPTFTPSPTPSPTPGLIDPLWETWPTPNIRSEQIENPLEKNWIRQIRWEVVDQFTDFANPQLYRNQVVRSATNNETYISIVTAFIPWPPKSFDKLKINGSITEATNTNQSFGLIDDVTNDWEVDVNGDITLTSKVNFGKYYDGRYNLFTIAASNARNSTGADLRLTGTEDGAQITAFLLSHVFNINTNHGLSILYFTDGDINIGSTSIDLFPTTGAGFGNPNIVNEQLMILGSGRGQTRFNLTANVDAFLLAKGGTNAEGKYYFADLTVNGNKATYTSTTNNAFGTTHSQLTLQNIEVKNFAGWVNEDSLSQLIAKDCHFTSNGNGIRIGSGGDDSLIDNCYFNSTVTGVHSTGVGSVGVKVINSKFSTLTGTAVITGQDWFLNNLIITGQTGSPAISAAGSDIILSNLNMTGNGSVTGITISGADCLLQNSNLNSFGTFVSTGNGTQIENCKFFTGGLAVSVPITGVDVSVIDCEIDGMTLQGIFVNRSTNRITLAYNKIKNVASHAIQVVGENSFNSVDDVIIGNTITETGSSTSNYAIYIQATNALIAGNMIRNSTGTGSVIRIGTAVSQDQDVTLSQNLWCGYAQLYEKHRGGGRVEVRLIGQTLTECANVNDVQVEIAQGVMAREGILNSSGVQINGDIDLSGSSQRIINFRNGNNISTLDFEFPELSTANGAIRFFKTTNTSGTRQFQIFKGDGSANIQHLFDSFNNSYVNALAGNFGVGTTSPAGLLHVDKAGDQIIFVVGEISTSTANTTGYRISPWNDNNIYQYYKMGTGGVVQTFYGVGGAAANTRFSKMKSGDLYIGEDSVNPTGQLHVDQSSTTGAKPVLTLDQADVSEELISLIGTSTTDSSQSLVDAVDLPTPGTLKGWVKVKIQDDQVTNPIPDGVYYVPFYSAPTP